MAEFLMNYERVIVATNNELASTEDRKNLCLKSNYLTYSGISAHAVYGW
jgi:hypothetical protein